MLCILSCLQDNLSFPLICPDWNADDEILLLEVLHVFDPSVVAVFLALQNGYRIIFDCYTTVVSRELKCMAWGTGQKLLSMSGQRVKSPALNTMRMST